MGFTQMLVPEVPNLHGHVAMRPASGRDQEKGREGKKKRAGRVGEM